MSTKVCFHCELEKTLEKFPKYKKRDGTHSYRNVCQECFLKQSNESRKKKPDEEAPIKKRKLHKYKVDKDIDEGLLNVNEYKIERNKHNMFNQKQTDKLILLADNADDLIKLLNTKIELYVDENKSNRIKKTINLDGTVYDKLKQQCKKTNLNMSDLINSMLKKALEYMD